MLDRCDSSSDSDDDEADKFSGILIKTLFAAGHKYAHFSADLVFYSASDSACGKLQKIITIGATKYSTRLK